MHAADAIPQCECDTCTDPRAAMLADLRAQCACAERVCSPCAAIGRLTGTYRCERCREWTPRAEMMGQAIGRALCGDCWDDLYGEEARNP